MGTTNRWKFKVLDWVCINNTLPTNFYVALVTDATTPVPTTNVLGDLTEIPAGNGYTAGGFQLARNSTDFDTISEDDANNKASVQIKDIVFTASGGNLPQSGAGARWAVLTNDIASIPGRDVYVWWDLLANRVVSIGQTLTLQNLTIGAIEPS